MHDCLAIILISYHIRLLHGSTHRLVGTVQVAEAEVRGLQEVEVAEHHVQHLLARTRILQTRRHDILIFNFSAKASSSTLSCLTATHIKMNQINIAKTVKKTFTKLKTSEQVLVINSFRVKIRWGSKWSWLDKNNGNKITCHCRDLQKSNTDMLFSSVEFKRIFNSRDYGLSRISMVDFSFKN